MAFSLTALLSFLPQFAIGGILAIYFFTYFKRLSPFSTITLNLELYKTEADKTTRPKFSYYNRTQGELDNLLAHSFGIPENSYFVAKKTKINLRKFTRSNFMADVQLLILTLNLWIILSLVLSPMSRVSTLLPSIPAMPSTYLYIVLSATLSAAVLTTASSRLMPRGKILALFVGASGVSTFLLLYYSPIMAWVNDFVGIYKFLILYSTVVVVCFAAYLVASYSRRQTAFLASSYASFASYALTAFLLFFNMVAILG